MFALSDGNSRTTRAVFPRDEEELSFTKVELEVMSSCPSEMSARHSEMRVATWVSEDGGKERNSWVLSALQLKRIHVMWLRSLVI